MSDEIKPIRTEADNEAALAEVRRLWDAEEGTPEADRLEVLVTLIDAFESEHYRFDAGDPVDAIEVALEERGLTSKDLEPLIGSSAQVAEVLGRKRDLSVGMIRQLHQHLGISADVLIRPTRAAGAR